MRRSRGLLSRLRSALLRQRRDGAAPCQALRCLAQFPHSFHPFNEARLGIACQEPVAMGMFPNLSLLAVRQLASGAARALGSEAAGEAANVVIGVLTRHFTDHSQRLSRALGR